VLTTPWIAVLRPRLATVQTTEEIVKLSEALTEFDLALIGCVAESTRSWYRKRLRGLARQLGDVDIEEVSVSDLRRWRKGLVKKDKRWVNHPTKPAKSGGLSPWTIRGHVRACRRFFRWLVEDGILEVSPAQRLRLPAKPPSDPKAITAADVEAMYEGAENTRDRAIISFLADTGCRVGGLCGVKLCDVDLDAEPVHVVVREKSAGGLRPRAVYLGARGRADLEAWLEERDDASDYVFVSQRGGPLTTGGLYQVLKRLARKAGVEGRYNPHAFRHAFVRGALDNGADLGTVSQLAGHSSVMVTGDIYGRWADQELAERHTRYCWFEKHVNGNGSENGASGDN
jgi:site-specific recombinase XerD